MVLERDQARKDAGRVFTQAFHIEARKDKPEDIAAVRAIGKNMEDPGRFRTDRARTNGLERIVKRKRDHEVRPNLDLRGQGIEYAASERPLGVFPCGTRRSHVLVQIEKPTRL